MASKLNLMEVSDISGAGCVPTMAKVLHQGLTSCVFYGYHPVLERNVVVKAYNRHKLTDRQLHDVEHEIHALQHLKAQRVSGVVCMLETYRTADDITLVFEPCMRGDLYHALQSSGKRMGEEFVCKQVIAPLLDVLIQLHQLHIIHRDIKPENLLFDASGHLLVGDFGLAVDQSSEQPLLRAGTLDYMCPEVLRQPTAEQAEMDGLMAGEQQPYTEKVDIWAVGVLVYELLCGKTPFEVDDLQQTAQNILTGMLPVFPDHMSSASRDFVMAALAHDPAQRPSAQQLTEHPWMQRHGMDVDCVAVVTLGVTPSKSQQGAEQQESGSGCAYPLAVTPEAQKKPVSRMGWQTPAPEHQQLAWKTPGLSTAKKSMARSRFAA